MTQLERLFRLLVDNLIAIDPARLHRPIPVTELLDQLVPYRTSRRALQVDSIEDHEALLLQLCAGDEGLVQVEPAEARAAFRAECDSSTPDLEVLRRHGEARFTLATRPLAHALGPDPDEAYARPEPDVVSEPTPPPAERTPVPVLSPWQPLAPEFDEPEPDAAAAEPAAAPAGRCHFCGGRLPEGRQVKFCPHCGQGQSSGSCPRCGGEVELEWRHCITCGHAVGEPE